ncbi:MAG: S41 family peptidase [Dehalococcoidia bacterium]
METSRVAPPPSGAERAARWAVLGFLAIASLTLVLGLGWFLGDRNADTSTTAPAAAQSEGDASSPSSSASGSIGAAVIDEIVNVLESQHVDRKTLDADALKEAAIDGMIASLNDRETHFISAADLKAGALQLAATYQGIGASVSDRNGAIQIVAPFRDSPAEKAGIQASDIVLEVDGELTDGWTSQHAVDKIRGVAGTVVKLKVRHGDGQIEEIAVTRGDIDIQSVYAEPNLELLPGESKKAIVDRTGAEAKDIAYIAISQFHEKTLSEFKAVASDIEKDGYKGLVLDLRGNPGGGLQATIDVADEFLNKGTIIIEVDSNGKQSGASAGQGGILTKIPVVVLMDKGSASGAEVLAAAIRDNGRGTIVGTTSFGKGTVNRLFPLKSCGSGECGAVYVAVGRWLTPKGDQIEGIGVTPDVDLPMTGTEYEEQGDIQVFKAIDILRGIK